MPHDPVFADEHPPGLHAGSMSGFEVLSQSVAGIAPSAVMATGPALVALGAGNDAMYSYVASTTILLMVGWCIAQYAERSGTDATLLSFIRRAFGPGVGFVSTAGLVVGYSCIAMACLPGIVLYASPLLELVGVPVGGTRSALVIVAVSLLLAQLAMTRGVSLSTRIGMVLEIVSVLAVLGVILVVLTKAGLSTAPLAPEGLSLSGVTAGMVLALLGYVGFESAACMGTEARNPRRTIPFAVMASPLLVGVLYLLSCYAQLVGFGGAEGLTGSANPLNDLATTFGVSSLGYVVDFGATASFFACVTGSLNAASRLLHAYGLSGMAHGSLGQVHPVHRTPTLAIRLLCGLCGVVVGTMLLAGVSPIDVFALLGTIGTFGYMLAYIALTAGVVPFLSRLKEKASPALMATAVVATLGLGYVLLRNVYPPAAAPYNLLPPIFAGLLLAASAWFLSVRHKVSDDVVIDLVDDQAPTREREAVSD